MMTTASPDKLHNNYDSCGIGESLQVSPTGNATVGSLEDEISSPEGFARCPSFDKLDSTIPLKGGMEEPMAEIPRPNFKTSNSLRNLTEQLTKEGKGGKLPLSPVLKRETFKSPYNSPGALGNRIPPMRVSSGGLLGGSLHRRMIRTNSPGGLGGSLHGAPRQGVVSSRNQSLEGSLHGVPRSRRRSTSPIPRGSLRGGKSNGLSPPASQLNGSRHGNVRPRSDSPGPLSGASSHGLRSGGSSHGLRSGSPGPLMGSRARSKSPGGVNLSRRLMRAQQRQSFKNKSPSGPVSIMRKGKFSQPRESEVSLHIGRSMHSVASTTDGGSPPGNSFRRSKRSLVPKMKRVSFWFHDEPSIAMSYETEDSMQFADLGFDSSGEVSLEGERGQRGMRGELAFIEVMDFEGSQSLNDDYGNEDEYDCMVKRFNGSTIHEELGASLGGGLQGVAFGSLLSDSLDAGDTGARRIAYQYQSRSLSDGSFAIPDLDDDSDHYPSRIHDSLRHMSEASFALPDLCEPGPSGRGSSRTSTVLGSSVAQSELDESASISQGSSTLNGSDPFIGKMRMRQLNQKLDQESKLPTDTSTYSLDLHSSNDNASLREFADEAPGRPAKVNNSNSSIVSEGSTLEARKATSRIGNLKRRTSTKSTNILNWNRESMNRSDSETSSESPTCVKEICSEEAAEVDLDEDERTDRGQKRSDLVSKLVEPIG